MSFVSLLPKIDRTLHSNDALAPVYEKHYGLDEYFRGALAQTDILQDISEVHLGRRLANLGGIADFACHYGRLLRALRLAAPKVPLVACDIDQDALQFCARRFNAEPFHSAWTPAAITAAPSVELLVCVSLLTHTRRAFFTDILHLWKKMVRPGGLLIFTFLGEGFITDLEEGKLAHYGPSTPDDSRKVREEFTANRHAFFGFETPYSPSEYGVGFLSDTLVAGELRVSEAFDLLEIRKGPENGFGQDLAIARRRHDKSR